MTKTILFFALFLGLFVPVSAQVTVAPITNPRVVFFTAAGVPCNACQLDTFAAGTTTPQATYSDSAGTVLNANPIILGSDGSAVVYLTSASYKFRLRASVASGGATLWTQDNITWATPLSTFSGLSDAGNFTQTQPTAATSGANQSSFSDIMQGNYWTGSASAIDSWTFQDVLGTGSNPTSTFTLTHSGSSGAATFSVPGNQTVGGTLGVTGATTLAAVSTTGVTNSGSETITGTLGVTGVSTFTATAKGNASGGQSGTAFSAIAATPGYSWQATGAGVDQKWWDCFVSGNTTFTCRTVNDANNSAVQWLTVNRGTGTAVSSITFGSGGGVQTLPTATDTLVGRATTDTLTNKTLTSPTSTGTDNGTETLTNKTLGGAGSTTPFTVYNRMKVGQGTALATTDFSISAGWGTTASVSSVVGTDARFRIVIASSGTGQTVNPTVTVTFHDGTWTNPPICIPLWVGSQSPAGIPAAENSVTATSGSWFFLATASAGNSYTLIVDCQGR